LSTFLNLEDQDTQINNSASKLLISAERERGGEGGREGGGESILKTNILEDATIKNKIKW
jgi:hypothetical protein